MTYKIRGESVPVYDGLWKSSGVIFPNRVNLLRKREAVWGCTSAIKTSSFFPPKNVRGRKDRDYHCDRHTHLKTLDITIITAVPSKRTVGSFLTAV